MNRINVIILFCNILLIGKGIKWYWVAEMLPFLLFFKLNKGLRFVLSCITMKQEEG